MNYFVSQALCVIFCVCIFENVTAVSLRTEYSNHKAVELSNDQILKLARLSDVDNFEAVLDKILVPRVVGTPNHEKVKQYLMSSMKDLGWHVELDSFQDDTPGFGRLTFDNVIASINPDARRFLVLACHYDSKYFREGSFLGATDSAVPCAMMINLAKTLQKQLATTKNKTDLSLKFIFFDGEEAFETWGPKDSIYGARHLAQKWSKSPGSQKDETFLDRIDVLVLLDLLGAPDPNFFSFFSNTESWYRMLVNAEDKLSRLGHMARYSATRVGNKYFHSMSTNAAVEDDHVPFLRRGVPILHVIPNPFPRVWHTEADNRRAVDLQTVENLNKIFRVFVAEYLGLSV